MKKIAIQGIEGSFHDIAAHRYFATEPLEMLCCDTFEEMIARMDEDREVIGLMAIENTIAGSLLGNYELLRESGASIVGEYKLHIRHSIMCLPDDDWQSVSEVNSHPVALMQCRGFLSRHPNFKVVEHADTAGAARDIARKELRGHAAICHAAAAGLYGLKVLEDGIEDNKHNFTRFLVLTHPSRADKLRERNRADKSSLVFTLPHTSGSLSHVLSIFDFYRINLTKIQSLPIIGSEWEYLFYVDVTYDDPVRFHQSIEAVRPLTSELRVLGEYNEAATPDLSDNK
ncbi:MAG: prephenate dehydratase [Bacteroidaceae bacterium]|nr:prephenate dehydratase [Bacteroidaceae bacterium]